MSNEVQVRSGAQAIVRSLIDHKVDTVFGIPGVQLDPLFDAFYGESNRLRVVHTRHEQGAAFMAAGYAQASGRDGVFAVVPGPGLLNAGAALSTAVACNAPVLGLTGQVPSKQIRSGMGFAHELRDQLKSSEAIVDWVGRAQHPREVGAMLADAFAHMHAPRKRCAVFEMAPDQLSAQAPVVDYAPREVLPFAIDTAQVERAAAVLAKAQRPVIMIGGGAMDAGVQVMAIARRLNAPVIMSNNAIGAVPASQPLVCNMLAGQRLWPDVDVVLAIGTRLLAPALAWGIAADCKLLRIDADPVQITKPTLAHVSILADAGAGCALLLEALDEQVPPRVDFLRHVEAIRTQVANDLSALQPQADFMRAIRGAMPADGILSVDVTQMATFARYGGFATDVPRTLLTPGYQATLGYGMPAALGAKVAMPERAVVSISGDGGFMFTVQELASAAHHGIAVVAIVFDNSSYGNVKVIQRNQFGGRHIGVDLTNPDLVALGRAFGLRAELASTPDELRSALEACLACGGPALIHVPIGEVPSIWDLVKRPPSAGTPAS
jgi:acetolactate synthase-1/2/3 large subunit